MLSTTFVARFSLVGLAVLVVVSLPQLSRGHLHARQASSEAELLEEREKQEELSRLTKRVLDTEDLDTKLGLLNQMLAIDVNNAFAISERERVLDEIEERDREVREDRSKEEQYGQLRRGAEESYNARDWAEAVRIYGEIVELDPADDVAKARLNRAQIELKSQNQMWWFKLIALVILAVALIALVYYWWTRKRPSLVIIAGRGEGTRFRLDRDEIVVGALESEVDLPVSDAEKRVSRRHCTVHRSGRNYFLTDSSMNGTSVNGVAIPFDEPVQLRRGDQISIAGVVTLRFR
jgi:hypothetical protein